MESIVKRLMENRKSTNPYVHRNEKENCYDCGHDGWSYDEKDDDEDLDEAEDTTSDVLTVGIPTNILKHIHNKHITVASLRDEMRDWDGMKDADISIGRGTVSVKGLTPEWYKELAKNLARWLKQYGGDLDSEYDN